MAQYDSENNLVGKGQMTPDRYVDHGIGQSVPRKARSNKAWWIGGILAALVIIGAVLGGVLGTQLNKNKGNANKDSANGGQDSNGKGGESSGTNGGSPTSSGSAALPTGTAASGADGSTITMDDGNTFTYVNKFGGSWAVDPQNPYNVSAVPQGGAPPLTFPDFRTGPGLHPQAYRGVGVGQGRRPRRQPRRLACY